MISVVCPFFNESAIIEGATRHMLDQLARLEENWELLLVNDGSTDESFALAKALEPDNPRLRVTGYERNRGRGAALAFGIRKSRGDIVVTTEVDCSWGDDIVHRIVAKFRTDLTLDMVIASPNLPGGGYRNVPLKRVWISRIGNKLLRLGQSTRITMYTGMTRGYRRDRFLALPIDEMGKEFHLDVARKALAFGYRIAEVPAVLEWKDHKFSKPDSTKRKSSSRIDSLIRTHLTFALSAAPFRFMFGAGTVLVLFSLIPLGLSIYNLFTPTPSAFLALTGLSLLLFAFLCIALGILALQNLAVQRDLWRLRSDLSEANESQPLLPSGNEGP